MYVDNKCKHWVNFKGNAQEKSSVHVFFRNYAIGLLY